MRDLVPGIYCHWVVDEHGRHPTIADIEKILAHMLKYVTDPDLNFQRRIDTKIGPHPPLADGKRRAANFRRYQSRDIQNQSANIKIFMGPPQRSDRTNRGQEPATLGGLSEVGWVIKPCERLAAHGSHRNSNYVMNLFEACSIDLFGDRYRTRGFVVYRVYDMAMASCGEFWATLLTHGWLATGDGFSHKLPGDNNTSINALRTSLVKAIGVNGERDGWIDIGGRRKLELFVADTKKMRAEIAELIESRDTSSSDMDIMKWYKNTTEELKVEPGELHNEGTKVHEEARKVF